MKHSIRYISSALTSAEWPLIRNSRGEILPEIALVGRSNVGKSTFINLLADSKTLAKTSSKPGKTQRLQFFCVDEDYLIVDLPGFGFAKAPHKAQIEWSIAIDDYLMTRPFLRLILLFLDIRRDLTSVEFEFLDWAKNQQIAILPILTKNDKLTVSTSELYQKKIITALLPYDCLSPLCLPNIASILYSHLKKILMSIRPLA